MRKRHGDFIKIEKDEWRGVVSQGKIAVGAYYQNTLGDSHGTSIRLNEAGAIALQKAITKWLVSKRPQKVWYKGGAE